MKILQIALDTNDLFKALKLALRIEEELDCKGIWLEAGTPLIKAWGTLAVTALKEATGCFIVADTKTMDTGSFEAEIMLGAGADAVTVLGLADDSTVKGMIDTARKHGKLVMADLINHPKPVERALQLDELGVDIILYHVGIDVQEKRRITIADMVDEIRELKRMIRARIAVAGGIKHGKAKPLADAGADIIIIGGAITKAENPVESTRKFLEELEIR